MKPGIVLAARVISLTVVLFICFAVAGAIVRLPGGSGPEAQAGNAALLLLAVCLLNVAVFTHLILRSRWAGWRLVAAVAVVHYGVATVMGQLETAVFVTRLPPGALPRLFAMGALVAAPFAALSVVILGKHKAATADTTLNSRLVMPASEWAWKLGVIAVAYVILYFTFGYFIAWQSPEVRAYYGAGDLVGFVAHLGTVVRDTPWLVPFQVMRAILWTAIALPVIRMMKGERLETMLAVGLLFAVVMNAQLLLPNPYMPRAVRMAHLVETASSNFLFGVLIAWLLSTRHTPAAPNAPLAR